MVFKVVTDFRLPPGPTSVRFSRGRLFVSRITSATQRYVLISVSTSDLLLNVVSPPSTARNQGRTAPIESREGKEALTWQN